MDNKQLDGSSLAQQAQVSSSVTQQNRVQPQGMIQGIKNAEPPPKDNTFNKDLTMMAGPQLKISVPSLENHYNAKNKVQASSMNNNKNQGEDQVVEEGKGASPGDEDSMTPPNERPKRFHVKQYFRDQLSIQNMGNQPHSSPPFAEGAENEFGLNSSNYIDISASMYLVPYGKSESVQAKKNPLIFQKGSPIEQGRTYQFKSQMTVQQNDNFLTMNANKGNGKTQEVLMYGRDAAESEKINARAANQDQQNSSSQNQSKDNILIKKLDNGQQSAVESTGAKVGGVQVKTSEANNIKICSFMEEDNFLNSHEANKRISKNVNLLSAEKQQLYSIPGMIATGLNSSSRFGNQGRKQSVGKDPKNLSAQMQGDRNISFNPNNANAWLSPDSVTGNSAAFTINKTHLPGQYGMQGVNMNDSKEMHQIVIEESDESSSKKPSSDETAKKDSDGSHKSLNQNTDGNQLKIGQSLNNKGANLLFQSEENKEYVGENSMENEKEKGYKLNQNTEKSPKVDYGLWNPFSIFGIKLNMAQPEVSHCSSQASKRITYSIKYQPNADVPEIRRQDTPGFLTSQQMNLRRIMHGNGEESVSASQSINNRDQLSRYSGLSQSRANFTIGGNMISPQDLGFIEASLSPLQFQELQDNKMIFVTQEDILGSKKILYTNLDYDINIMNRKSDEVNNPHTDRYKKESPKKLTLVLEMVDILLKVIDINSKEQLCLLHDQSMHQIALKSATIPNSFEVIVTRFMKTAMIKSLRDLQDVCELVLFTYLPRNFVDELLKFKLPELREIFSFIICNDEIVEVGDFRIKDLSILLKSRNSADIVIVDTLAERIDEEIFSSIIVSEYNGTVAYTNQLILLKTTLKQINDQDLISQQQQNQKQQQQLKQMNESYNQDVQPDEVIQKKQTSNKIEGGQSEVVEHSRNSLSMRNVDLGNKTQVYEAPESTLMNNNGNSDSSKNKR